MLPKISHPTSPPLISHPFRGATITNVTSWLKLAGEAEGDGWRAWHLAITYLKEDGFIMFAGAWEVDSKQQWLAELDVAQMELNDPNPDWWAGLQRWCQSTQIRAVQDMAFHDKASWMNAWVIRDQPTTASAPLVCYDRWLQHREDVDIGYVLANPGNFPLHPPLLEVNVTGSDSSVFALTMPMCPTLGRCHGTNVGAQ